MSASSDFHETTNRLTTKGRVEHTTIHRKGEFLSGGVSGIVERLPSGHVAKSPWPGLRETCCRRDLNLEAKVYRKLTPHPRLVDLIEWDPESCTLILEYMPNGNLEMYLRAHKHTIPHRQRLRWIQEAAEGLETLHCAGVRHCDVEPKNFLLDRALGLRIADFGGSSIDGSQATACPGTRFEPPNYDWHAPQTIKDDIFALGGVMYHILTGEKPYQDVPSDEVKRRYQIHEFPDVTGISCGGIIDGCWRGEISSAQEVADYISNELRCSHPDQDCDSSQAINA